MIAEDIRGLTIRLYQGQIARRDQHLAQTVNDALAQATSLGALQSSRMQIVISDLFASEYQARVDLLWDILQQVLSAHGISLVGNVASDLKGFLDEVLTAQKDALNQELWRNFDRFRSGGMSAFREKVSSQAIVSKNELDAKVDFFVLGLKARSHEAGAVGGPVQNFYGSTIGVVQTGNSSTAQVSQSLTMGDTAATERALDAVTDALKAHMELAGFTQAELLELVKEMRQEVTQPKPSRSKLTKIAGGLALAIQTSKDLKPAYELLRTVLLPWGVLLPTWP